MCFVPCDAIKKVLKILRPHYDEKKVFLSLFCLTSFTRVFHISSIR